ncbi:MAG: hypothetical protein II611_08920 [Treponema sp.]|nr:hypothetical protein [Treponema sp.]
MKRIFPKERVILGLLGIAALLFFWFTIFNSGFSLDAGSVMQLFLFALGLVICVNLITAHTAYNSERLLVWSFFYRKKINFDKITQICRTWQGSGKSLRLKWYVLYMDKNKVAKAKLYLPDDFGSESVANLASAIKAVNDKAVFVFDT